MEFWNTYIDSNFTTVDWPELPCDPRLDIPADLLEEPDWTLDAWFSRGFTGNYPPLVFDPLLSAAEISTLWEDTMKTFTPTKQQEVDYALLLEVASTGYDSQLAPLECSVSYKNVTTESRLVKPACQVIQKWIDSRFVSGPYQEPPFPLYQKNGLLLIPKGPSNVRLITDASKPTLKAFNDRVDQSFRVRLPLTMNMFNDFKHKLLMAGPGAYILKLDLCDAYKFCRTTTSQLASQVFSWGQCFFVDHCLIFGDVSAVHSFSAMHRVLLQYFCLPYASIPTGLSSLCVDDVVVVVPENWLQRLWQFYYRYKYVMEKVGFKLAEFDETHQKSFLPSQHGNVLGIYVDTRFFRWFLPMRKLKIVTTFGVL